MFIRKLTLPGLLLLLAALPACETETFDSPYTHYVQFEDSGETAWGILQGETIDRLSAAPWDGGTATGQTLSLASTTLLAPAVPRTAVLINVNYQSGVTGEQRPRPTIITIPPRAFVGHGWPIMRPAEVEEVRAEPTAAIVIGSTATNVSAAEAPAHILGVVPAIDVTAMDWRTGQWTRAKGTDSFKPMGPAIVSGAEYNDLTIVARHNGMELPSVQTSDMIWDFNELVSYVSSYMTLNPGDVILAGTAGPDFTVEIAGGDTLEVEFEGVFGTLVTPVESASPMTTLPPPSR
jgi:2-keto-4-pentenoate hydratase/2-oxohepta-3-ene-1,7-dioic acid hydratase in catechol pathway